MSLPPVSYRDPYILAALCLSPVGWFLPSSSIAPVLWWLLLTALAEEVFFRAVIQDNLGTWLTKLFPANAIAQERWKDRLPGTANIITSTAFASMHLFTHPPAWALATFAPSLIYGLLWDRHKSIVLCWAIHAVYNLSYFYINQ